MVTEALRFLINTVFGFLVYAALLRFIMQCLRAPFRNPVGQAVSALTDWAVKPLRKLLPGFHGYDWASLAFAWVGQVLWLVALAGISGAAFSPTLLGYLAILAVVELVTEVTQAAIAVLARHPLRMGDSVQLASCLDLRRRATQDVRLLAYDARLNDAARAEGMTLAGAE